MPHVYVGILAINVPSGDSGHTTSNRIRFFLLLYIDKDGLDYFKQKGAYLYDLYHSIENLADIQL